MRALIAGGTGLTFRITLRLGEEVSVAMPADHFRCSDFFKVTETDENRVHPMPAEPSGSLRRKAEVHRPQETER